MKKVEIGKNGIRITRIKRKKKKITEIPWEKIVGVNCHKTRSEIYLCNGKSVKIKSTKLRHLLFYYDHPVFNVYFYKDKEIGEGEGEKLVEWEEIFPIIKQHILKYGDKYVEELEGVYDGIISMGRFMDFTGIKFPEEEKKERKLFIYGAIVFLIWYIVTMIIVLGFHQIIPDTKMGFLYIMIFVITWLYMAGVVIHSFRKSKVKKILKRHKAYKEEGGK